MEKEKIKFTDLLNWSKISSLLTDNRTAIHSGKYLSFEDDLTELLTAAKNLINNAETIRNNRPLRIIINSQEYRNIITGKNTEIIRRETPKFKKEITKYDYKFCKLQKGTGQNAAYIVTEFLSVESDNNENLIINIGEII